MEIKVQKVLEKKKILFSSEFGNCTGYWCDGKVEIKSYFVEIDIPDKVFENQISESLFRECSISEENGKIKIIGLLEDYEEDGFATLRMNASLIWFETIFDSKIKAMKNKYVEILVSEINLYDEKVI